MKIMVTTKALGELRGPVLILPVFAEQRRAAAEIRSLPPATAAAIQAVFDSGDFHGKAQQAQVVYLAENSPFRRVILLGLSDRKKFNPDQVRRALGAAVRETARLKTTEFVFPVFTAAGINPRTFGQAAAEGSELANFQFADFLTDQDSRRVQIEHLTLSCPDRAKARQTEDGVARGLISAEAANVQRHLVMTPGNDLYPETLAKETTKMARAVGIKAEVLGPEQIKKLKMGGVWNVGKGSIRPPRLIVLHYKGNKKKKNIDVCLVGKGVTFDTGGISLKPNPRMTEMIGDMMGAATVIAATIATARLKLPVNLTTIVPTVENMPSGGAYRPGDIVTTMCGQTVEVISTDAEGRLILADALTYAERFSPQVVVDVATLTGGVEIALGNQAAALMTNDPPLAKRLQKAAADTAERIWELPMYPEYADQIKSDVADMKNSGGRLANTITAGWFLRKFVGDQRWAHLDIAGMDWETKGQPYIPKGCTGFGVRLLIEFLAGWK